MWSVVVFPNICWMSSWSEDILPAMWRNTKDAASLTDSVRSWARSWPREPTHTLSWTAMKDELVFFSIDHPSGCNKVGVSPRDTIGTLAGNRRKLVNKNVCPDFASATEGSFLASAPAGSSRSHTHQRNETISWSGDTVPLQSHPLTSDRYRPVLAHIQPSSRCHVCGPRHRKWHDWWPIRRSERGVRPVAGRVCINPRCHRSSHFADSFHRFEDDQCSLQSYKVGDVTDSMPVSWRRPRTWNHTGSSGTEAKVLHNPACFSAIFQTLVSLRARSK